MEGLSSSFLSSLHISTYPDSFSMKTKLNTSLVKITNTMSNSITTKSQSVTKNSGGSSSAQRKFRNMQSCLKPSFLAKTFKVLDEIIDKFVPLRPAIDPRQVLSENFAPVDELHPTECDVVEGNLPSCLNGAYFRIGPNPQFLPQGPYHLFDGDGMVHCLHIYNGKATLSSRYVKTYKYQVEHATGNNVIPNFFSAALGPVAFTARALLTAARIATGQFDPKNGMGTGNTSLTYIAGRLYALVESDLPYELRVTPEGDTETIGRQDFNGGLQARMTAHPKFDPETGETFAFRYNFQHPFLTYFWFDANGEKQPDVPISSMHRLSWLHDFAITTKYAIFADTQLIIDPLKMLVDGELPIHFKSTGVSRLGLIPRYCTSDTVESSVKWFDVPGFNVIHMINAWEEKNGDGHEEIIVVAPNIMSPEHTLENMELSHGSVEKVSINLYTGKVSRQPLSAKNLEFGMINSNYIGKKNRYIYAAIGAMFPKIGGVAKFDISLGEHERKECEVASRMYDSGCCGGEPYFVPRDSNDLLAEEDDGYIVSFVHDERTGESSFIVMDAQSPSLDIVATVKLPHRVPSGFHGLFLNKDHLPRTNM